MKGSVAQRSIQSCLLLEKRREDAVALPKVRKIEHCPSRVSHEVLWSAMSPLIAFGALRRSRQGGNRK